MRFSGTHNAAQVSGIAGLAGTNAGAVYGQYAAKVKQVFEQPYPTVTGTRPPDSLIFTDKYAYLRQVLNNADWYGVARWYATMIQQAVNYAGWYDPLYPPAPEPPPPPAPVVTYEPPPPTPVVTMPEAPPIIAPAPAPVVAVAPVRTPVLRSRDVRSGSRLAGLSDLSGLNPVEYWNLSKLNLQDYCDRTLNLQDLHAHTKECILKMCIADYGNKVGFGYAGRSDYLNLALFFANGLSHNSGQLDWAKSYEAAKNGTRYGFCLGWVKEPNKHTASNIIVAIGAAFMGAAAWQAISAGAGAASGGVTGAAGGTGAGAGAGAATGAATATGIETVVVSASAIAPVTAGTVAAGIASGTIAATAAAPAITAPTGTIETVVVEAAPVATVSAGTVAAGVGTGAIAATATAPPIVAPSTPAPSVIETVTTEASALPETQITAGTVAAGVAAGTIAATATAPAITSEPVIETVTVEAPADTIQLDPVEAAAIGTSVISLTQPVINVPEPNLPEIEDEPSLTDRVVEGLENAVAEYGADWVMSQLERLLTELLGRPPTQGEVDDWEDWLNGGGSTPPPSASSSPSWVYWLLGAAIAYALYEYSREPKKRRRESH